jgi:hypothetical protein
MAATHGLVSQISDLYFFIDFPRNDNLSHRQVIVLVFKWRRENTKQLFGHWLWWRLLYHFK